MMNNLTKRDESKLKDGISFQKSKIQVESVVSSASTREKLDGLKAKRSSMLKSTPISLLINSSSNILSNSDFETTSTRLTKLENTPAPVDPRLPELEKQVAELSAMVESLTMDKEQLAVDLELLDEKYLQAQIELEEALAEVQTVTSLHEAQTAAVAAHSTGSQGQGQGEGGDGALVLTLRAKNDKLREALRRLNSVSVQDKQTLGAQGPRLAALDKEVAELRVSWNLASCSIWMHV